MLWLILSVIVLVFCIWIATLDDNPILGIFLGIVFGAAIFVIGNNAMAAILLNNPTTKITKHTENVVALSTFSGQQGTTTATAFVFSGSITTDNNTYAGYRYYTRDTQGRVSLNELPAYSAYLIEDGGTQVVYYDCKRVGEKPSKWYAIFGGSNHNGWCDESETPKTELHIPVGSIRETVDVGLPR